MLNVRGLQNNTEREWFIFNNFHSAGIVNELELFAVSFEDLSQTLSVYRHDFEKCIENKKKQKFCSLGNGIW